MDFLTPQVLVLIPVVVGLVAVVKAAGLNIRYIPLVALIFGVLGAMALEGVSASVVIGGLVVGLSSMGLFSGTKTTTQG